ncbi:hypothetical protein CTZ27_00075 [Streptomyces griseocarneus]|nr:hypothetical protein CTZ27_00075 [Streptomyces griseocarneus]
MGWAVATAATGAWWWAGLRLLTQPDRSGPVEGLIIAGGWGLSLLPVHCVPRPVPRKGRGELRDRPQATCRRTPGS